MVRARARAREWERVLTGTVRRDAGRRTPVGEGMLPVAAVAAAARSVAASTGGVEGIRAPAGRGVGAEDAVAEGEGAGGEKNKVNCHRMQNLVSLHSHTRMMHT